MNIAHRCILHKCAQMRTTIDIPEPLLRRAKAEAALEGRKLKDIVSQALELLLRGDVRLQDKPEEMLPSGVRMRDAGAFRIPVLESKRPGSSHVSPEALKDLELNEDEGKYGRSS